MSADTPHPRWAVRQELVRTAAGLAAGPWHIAWFLARRASLRREIAADLTRPAPVEAPPLLNVTPGQRPIFVSCAEPSGELHAVNFVREWRALGATGEVAGLGSARLAAEGVRIIGDPVQRATMGFAGVAGALPFYVALLERCAEDFAARRPAVAVLVDSPALHVPLGRIAHRYGVPVLHFVTPQHWAWAPWRASAYADAVDRALTILPFEPAWFRRRGVPVAHVGHPLLDELASVPPVVETGASRTVVVLPGSRGKVIDLNLPWMLAVLERVRRWMPDLAVVVVQSGERHRARIEAHIAAAGAPWARLEAGDLHGSLARARAALSVSGTVLLDLLHHRRPTVCVYRVAGERDVLLYRHALLTPYFASVNLLAGREVVPEFCFCGEGPVEAVSEALRRAIGDEDYRRAAVAGLDVAAERLGPAGACRRAALHAMDLATRGG